MEPAKIDWKSIDSSFVEDNLYEHISAPKWVDFLAPQDSINDDAWFCRPECNHPKTADDFLKRPSISKILTPGSLKKTLAFMDRNQRDPILKRREHCKVSSVSNDAHSKFAEDSENQNPNLSTPPNHHIKSMKTLIKSSTEKKKNIDHHKVQHEETPMLKRTLSARNFFAGRDILGHITEFCYELKKLATRARERENEESSNHIKTNKQDKNELLVKEASCGVLGELGGREKERTPLIEVSKGKCEGTDNGSTMEKLRRKKRINDCENIPAALNLGNVNHKGEERLLQIRTNPPSPQCFSAIRVAPTKITPSKASRSRPMEKGILEERELNKQVTTKEEPNTNTNTNTKSVSVVEGREAPRGLDVFWFLKPCTLAE